MKKKILLILLMTMVFLIGIPQAEANRNIFNNFTKLYNVSNVSYAKLNTCRTCMVNTTPPVSWNKYGLELRSNAAFDRNNSMQGMKNIELLDSDGDGFINIDEIRNNTLPGNASDFPIISVTPSPTVTLTQIQTPTPTPTRTEPKPANTIMNGFVTLIMFSIVYFFVIRKRRE